MTIVVIILELILLYITAFLSLLFGTNNLYVFIPSLVCTLITYFFYKMDDKYGSINIYHRLFIINLMPIWPLTYSLCLATLITGTKIIETKDKQAVACQWYPFIPITYAEADEVSRIPAQNIKFYEPTYSWTIKTLQKHEIYLLKNKNGKLSIWRPGSGESNDTFHEIDDFTIVPRCYFPFGYINAIKFHKEGKNYITDIYGKKINIFDIPEIYVPEDVSYYPD